MKMRLADSSNSRRAPGFTLVEMLVVVVILVILTSVAVSSLSGVEDQTRYDATQRTFQEIRTAVLGPNASGQLISQNGQYLAGGYLQDIGWLPSQPLDLVGSAPSFATVPFQYNSTWNVYFGWRGPYVNPQPFQSGTQSIYDGWGSEIYGWTGIAPWSFVSASALVLQSTGADRALDSADAEVETGYDVDFPDSAHPVLSVSDSYSDVQSMVVRISLVSGSATALPAQCRLKIVIPRWDHIATPSEPLDYWPPTDTERTAWEHYSFASFPPPTAGGFIDVRFGNAPMSPLNVRRVPNGRRMLYMVNESTGLPAAPGVELILSPKVTLPAPVLMELR